MPLGMASYTCLHQSHRRKPQLLQLLLPSVLMSVPSSVPSVPPSVLPSANQSELPSVSPSGLSGLPSVNPSVLMWSGTWLQRKLHIVQEQRGRCCSTVILPLRMALCKRSRPMNKLVQLRLLQLSVRLLVRPSAQQWAHRWA